VDSTPDEPFPSFVPLRVGNDAAVALDEMCKLGYADTREQMAVIWIERWSRNPATWRHSEADPAPHLEGLASLYPPPAYARQPVAMTVALDETPMQVLRVWARKSAVDPERLASAVIDEHGGHVAADIRRRASRRLVGELRPCWCGQLNRWYTK
jgi:hypothetical protein